ncbi:immunoglobulin [Escherichia sp. E4385]|nr:immunoglobulin [Escherichia sp. E4385]
MIFIVSLFNKNNTLCLHVITNSFSPKSLFGSQYN